jgi:hypothetical protein
MPVVPGFDPLCIAQWHRGAAARHMGTEEQQHSTEETRLAMRHAQTHLAQCPTDTAPGSKTELLVGASESAGVAGRLGSGPDGSDFRRRLLRFA